MMKKLCFASIAFLVLTGCKPQNVDYDYLMLHPTAIKEALDHCQKIENRTEGQSPQCEMVAKAAGDIEALIEEEQQNPELFGQKILDNQVSLVEVKAKLIAAQNELTQLKNTHASAADIDMQVAKVDGANVLYEQVHKYVTVRLAVLSLASPE